MVTCLAAFMGSGLSVLLEVLHLAMCTPVWCCASGTSRGASVEALALPVEMLAISFVWLLVQIQELL